MGGLMKWLIVLLIVFTVADGINENPKHIIDKQCKQIGVLNPRPHSVSILEFGAVGNGKTLNTIAFQNAMFYLTSFSDKGGAQLYIPKGKWLTGSFNIISHLTIFLDKDAVIIATQDLSQWSVLDPLPSYGKGIEVPSGRYRSLIHGKNLTDVVITGDNGTIDGQGSIWWDLFRSDSLNYSRPHLIEFVDCDNVVISNLTFLNSPAWSIHPTYCSNVQIQNVNIVASSDSPLTNGIVPDSCSDICIEDCSIKVGHDGISLKSGWDQYGISYNKPLSNVYIRRINIQTSNGSALAFGSEMSGGISNVHIDDIGIRDSYTAISFKTTMGRGGYVKDIVISNVDMENVQTAMHFTGHCGRHPDESFDPHALPIFRRITVKDVVGKNISVAGKFEGLADHPFTTICLSNINFSVSSDPLNCWSCSNVFGFSESVFPEPCPYLQLPYLNSSSVCFSLQKLEGHAAW